MPYVHQKLVNMQYLTNTKVVCFTFEINYLARMKMLTWSKSRQRLSTKENIHRTECFKGIRIWKEEISTHCSKNTLTKRNTTFQWVLKFGNDYAIYFHTYGYKYVSILGLKFILVGERAQAHVRWLEIHTNHVIIWQYGSIIITLRKLNR